MQRLRSSTAFRAHSWSLGDEKADKAALSAKYADENSDPVNAAKNGYIDAIIEPQFVKQYLIASLQMLAK